MITAIILTKNEEKNIVDCLESLKFCDEIIIVDDYSEDRTIEVSRKYNAKIIRRKLNEDFSAQRNFAISQTKNEWILFIDADERVSAELKKEIISLVELNEYDAALIKRSDSMWGKMLKHGEVGNIKFLRLGKKNAGEWVGKIHEVWKINGRISTLKNPLYHFPHQTITEFLREINYYTTIRAKELHAKGVKVKWYSIIFYPRFKFFINFILKFGFLDGKEGFIFAIMMSFHSFLVRSKLWILNRKK